MSDDRPRPQAPKGLAEAVAVFRELGWEDADVTDAPNLPLASPEQRKVVVAGLKSGDWSDWERVDLADGRYTYEKINHAGVDLAMLRLFAVRHGVPTARAVALLTRGPEPNPEPLIAVVAERGPAFANAVVHSRSVPSRFEAARVALVHRFDLEPPAEDEYLRAWQRAVCGTIESSGNDGPPDAESLRTRLGDHLRVGSEIGSGRVPDALIAALHAGWLTRDEALEFALVGVDAAPRPKERTAWTDVLIDVIEMTDAELSAHAPMLTGLLATGDGPVVSAFAPRLIAVTDDADLSDVVTLALITKVKAVRIEVLTALAGRPAPAAPDPALLAQLSALATERAPKVAKAAAAVLDAWQASPVADIDDGGRGEWRPTPDVWQVPRLELGDPSEELTSSAAVLVSRGAGEIDVETERFAAYLVASAADDVEATRTALRGVKDESLPGLIGLADWVHDRQRRSGQWQSTSLTSDREWEYRARLGELPVLLSTPSWVDLRVDPADLIERLRTYADAGVAVGQFDLQLALTRLELGEVTPDQRAWLATAQVPLDGESGADAASIVLAYLEAPLREPQATWDGADEATASPALSGLDDLTVARASWDRWYDPVVHPSWEGATSSLGTWDRADHGLIVRQFVRRAAPFGPIASTRLLGMMRGLHHRAEADTHLAVVEAFERGLLRPGVADGREIGTRELAILARRWLELADDGLTSVVWPLLDSVIGAAISGPKMAAGVVDLAEAMFALTPTVLAAVSDGSADGSVLAVPGLRALARRGGSSRAVTVAREVVALLPVVDDAEPVAAGDAAGAAAGPGPRPVSDDDFVNRPSFDEVWPEDAGAYDAPDDRAPLSAEWAARGSAKVLALNITVDGPDGGECRVVNSPGFLMRWNWQCSIDRRTASGEWQRTDNNLWWDGTRLTLIDRDDRHEVAKLGIPVALHAVMLTLLCSDGDTRLGGMFATRDLIADGAIGWRGMRTATERLLASPDFSPARVATTIDKEPLLLPALWPVLVDSITSASRVEERLPRWLNGVLDMTRSYLPYIREASHRGWIPAEAATLPGLADIAARPDKSTAIGKARELVATVQRGTAVRDTGGTAT